MYMCISHFIYTVLIYNTCRFHPPKTISDMKQVELNARDWLCAILMGCHNFQPVVSSLIQLFLKSVTGIVKSVLIMSCLVIIASLIAFMILIIIEFYWKNQELERRYNINVNLVCTCRRNCGFSQGCGIISVKYMYMNMSISILYGFIVTKASVECLLLHVHVLSKLCTCTCIILKPLIIFIHVHVHVYNTCI